MKPLDRPLIASMFSVGKGGYSDTEQPLPPDALVIVIQDRPDALTLPPPMQRANCHHSKCEFAPMFRGNAEKAYAEHSPGRIPMINVSG